MSLNTGMKRYINVMNGQFFGMVSSAKLQKKKALNYFVSISCVSIFGMLKNDEDKQTKDGYMIKIGGMRAHISRQIIRKLKLNCYLSVTKLGEVR